MNCDQCIGTSIRNIQVDGSRPSLGWIAGGSGLIEIGGNAYYQTVDNCNIQHPRGWSALHVIGAHLSALHDRRHVLADAVHPQRAGATRATARSSPTTRLDPLARLPTMRSSSTSS